MNRVERSQNRWVSEAGTPPYLFVHFQDVEVAQDDAHLL